ncbi:hypothetical protein TNCV_49671 [Trichonephila clavipes]|nr:hypothetical protein TNCV_49671 [Trichonephila clavipes]
MLPSVEANGTVQMINAPHVIAVNFYNLRAILPPENQMNWTYLYVFPVDLEQKSQKVTFDLHHHPLLLCHRHLTVNSNQNHRDSSALKFHLV